MSVCVFCFSCLLKIISFKFNFSGKKGSEWSLFGLGGLSKNEFDHKTDTNAIKQFKDFFDIDFKSKTGIMGLSNWSRLGPRTWLKVALAGTVSNRNGLGATVRVVAGGRVFTQWNDGKSGYLSQSVLPLYFGLGDLTKVDRVEVDWPSGRKQVVTAGLSANSTLRVTEVR